MTAHPERGVLADAEWAVIGPMLPPERGRPGRPAHDNRRVLDGILWVLRTGAPWRDLPEAYGKWNSVFVRFSRWTKAGLWDAVLHVLTTLGLADHARPGRPRPPQRGQHALCGPGVGCRFQAWAACSNQVPISVGLCGCWPSSVRCLRTRWMDSAMFSQLPPSVARRKAMDSGRRLIAGASRAPPAGRRARGAVVRRVAAR